MVSSFNIVLCLSPICVPAAVLWGELRLIAPVRNAQAA